MVGVKTWEDEQIALILACKAEGKKVPEIIAELKKRWPRKQIRDSGVRYVMTNYKEIPETQTMAGGSKSRISQGPGSHASQKRAHPKEIKQAKSTARPAPKRSKLRTKPSQSPPAPPAPYSPQMDYSARMREISGGPLEATFNSPQPFKVLKDRVPSTTRLLAHARQAQNIGINAIEFGAKVPAPPEEESIMAHPGPYRRATVPEAHATPVGVFEQHDMHRTVSIPPTHALGRQFGAMAQQDMGMIGHQTPQMGSMHMAPPRTSNARSQYPQVQGNGQHMGLYQGHLEGMGVNLGMNMGPSFGYSSSAQMLPPQTPQRSYYQSQLNYGPDGVMGGMMPGNMQFGQLYSGQVANPGNNGQYRLTASAMPRTNPAMAKIDPSLDPRLFNEIPIMNVQQAAITMSNVGRTPSRTGSTTTPQPNHPPQSITQGTQTGLTGTPRASRPANAVAQEKINQAATPRLSRPATSTTRETQNGEAATPQLSRPESAVTKEPQNRATSGLSRPGSSTAQQPRNETSGAPETNLSDGVSAGLRTRKVLVTLKNPQFEEPFSFPSSNEGWGLFLNENMKVESKDQQMPASSYCSVSKGDFEVHFINPTFHKGIIWESVQSNGQIKSPSPGVKMDLDRLNDPKPRQEPGSSQNLSPSAQNNEVAKQQTARKAPAVSASAQVKPTPEPKTPSMKVPPPQFMEKTPSMSPLRLTEPEGESPEAIRRPIPRPPIGVRKSNLGPRDMTKSSPQTHIKKSHNPQTGKRTGSTEEREVSPSKRHKAIYQIAQHAGGASVSSSKTRVGSNNMESTKRQTPNGIRLAEPVDPLVQTSSERSFAAAVAQLPVPRPFQLLPPAQGKAIRQSQAQKHIPPRPFSPKPSQPLNNFDLFQAQSPQQYSAAMAERLAGELKRLPGFKFPNGNGIAAGILPFVEDGLPAQPPQQQDQEDQQDQGNANDANDQQQPQQNQELDLFEAMGVNSQQQNQDFDFAFDANAANSQYLLDDADFNLVFGGANDNFDLDQILGLNGADAASPPLSFPENANPDTTSNSNLASSSPETPPQREPDPNSAEYLAYHLDMDIDDVRAMLQENDPGPWRPGSNASVRAQMLAEFERDGGDFKDILDLEGVGDPARNGGVGVDMAA